MLDQINALIASHGLSSFQREERGYNSSSGIQTYAYTLFCVFQENTHIEKKISFFPHSHSRYYMQLRKIPIFDAKKANDMSFVVEQVACEGGKCHNRNNTVCIQLDLIEVEILTVFPLQNKLLYLCILKLHSASHCVFSVTVVSLINHFLRKTKSP